MQKRLFIWSVLGITLLGVSAAFGWKKWHSPPEGKALPVLGKVKDFALIDEQGLVVSRDTVIGSPWVADFIYTRCPGQCPMLSTQMAKLQALIPPESPAQLISITVDPAHDTPAILTAYAKRYGAKHERWRFLTGEAGEVRRLARDSFKLTLDKKDMIHHSNRFVLVDADAQVRGYYDGLDSRDVQNLVKALSQLATKAKETP